MAVSIEKLHSLFLQSTGVTTDSRNCTKGSIFFALKGETFNGNKYAKQAIDLGCAFAIVDERIDDEDERVIYVEDVLKTLQHLANFHRNFLKTKIIGITGTNGKTTTKELIYAVCSSRYNTLATIGNLNNHIGVPLTLLRLTKAIEIGIIEMGANHIGEIKTLASIAEPNIGLITNVGKAHIEGFGSFEGVKKAKGELYEFLKRNNQTILINSSNTHLMQMVGEYPVISYSSEKRSGLVFCTEYKLTPYLTINFQIENNQKVYSVKTNLIGSYNIENVLASISIGVLLNIETDKIIEAIETYMPSNNRSQLTNSDRNKLIVDCYNANPSSMAVAINNFKEIADQKKVVILGEMLELGDDSYKEHETLLKTLENIGCPIYLIGKEFSHHKNIYSNLKWYEKADDLIASRELTTLSNCTILIKGSRGNRLENLIPHL